MRVFSARCVIGLVLSAIVGSATAQQRVHAVAGTVRTVNPKIKMVTVQTDDGSSEVFDWVRPGAAIDFDKGVKAAATPVEKFTGTNTRALVFYVSDGDLRSAVAVRPVEGAPAETVRGTVVKCDRRSKLLVLRTSAGAEETLALDGSTVGDTPTGVVTGLKFDFRRDTEVWVTASGQTGNRTALLIVPVI